PDQMIGGGHVAGRKIHHFLTEDFSGLLCLGSEDRRVGRQSRPLKDLPCLQTVELDPAVFPRIVKISGVGGDPSGLDEKAGAALERIFPGYIIVVHRQGALPRDDIVKEIMVPYSRTERMKGLAFLVAVL